MVAYDDNFKLMLWLSLAAIPLVLFLRKALPTGADHSNEQVVVE